MKVEVLIWLICTLAVSQTITGMNLLTLYKEVEKLKARIKTRQKESTQEYQEH